MTTRSFTLALLVVAIQAGTASASCADQYFNGVSPKITNPAMQREAREVCSSGYALVHSGLTRTPLWSAEDLTRARVEAAASMKRKNSFHSETGLPTPERAELNDYAHSGYDRGHMSPSGDMPDAQAQYESFSLANMIPQNSDNNRRLWEGIESAVRSLAKQAGNLYVVTGPLFEGAQVQQLHGRVMVPTQIYKAVYDPSRQEAGAYLVNNAPGMAYQVVSIADIEKLAGVDLFPGMSAQVKSRAMALPTPTPHGYASGTKTSEGHAYAGQSNEGHGGMVTHVVEHEVMYQAVHGAFNGIKHHFFR